MSVQPENETTVIINLLAAVQRDPNIDWSGAVDAYDVVPGEATVEVALVTWFEYYRTRRPDLFETPLLGKDA